MADLIEAMRRVSRQTQEHARPMNAMFGEVVCEEPLEIVVEQKLRLGPAQLILARSVTDHELEIDMALTTGSAEGHSHGIAGVKTVTVRGALKTGESVLLLRQHGGQKYVVMDRVVSA